MLIAPDVLALALALVDKLDEVDGEGGLREVVRLADGVSWDASADDPSVAVVADETEIEMVRLRTLTGREVSGALIVAGTGTFEVSDGTGELKEPDIPVRLLWRVLT